jgi:hypothetical protein
MAFLPDVLTSGNFKLCFTRKLEGKGGELASCVSAKCAGISGRDGPYSPKPYYLMTNFLFHIFLPLS